MRNSKEATAKRIAARLKNEDCVCFQEIILEIMSERKLTDAQIVRDTGISWGTWYSWVTGEVKAPLLNGNLLALSKYFNVSINYLAFGVGDSEPFYKTERIDN